MVKENLWLGNAPVLLPYCDLRYLRIHYISKVLKGLLKKKGYERSKICQSLNSYVLFCLMSSLDNICMWMCRTLLCLCLLTKVKQKKNNFGTNNDFLQIKMLLFLIQ